MKIIVVLMGDLYKFPPVLNLINAFQMMNIETVVVSSIPSGDCSISFKHVLFDIIPIKYEQIKTPFKKMASMLKMHKELWKRIDRYYDENSTIWAITDVSLKFLGKELLNRNYILYLLELSQELRYYKKLPFPKIDSHQIGSTAKAVIVPEYNRAHIIAAWWQLNKIPYILPNKPFIKDTISENAYIEDESARAIIEKIGDRRIILYQGILNKERPLEEFVKAVDCYDKKYVFVVMSGDPDLYSSLQSDNYYYIPYIKAPEHLQVTSHAHIGVLSYVPTQTSGYSPLNSLYCAPNKTYEFSKFGIPMIGNDIPGLRYLFNTEGIGCCFEKYDESSICEAIDTLEKNYSEYSIKAKHFFENTNYEVILKNIIDDTRI